MGATRTHPNNVHEGKYVMSKSFLLRPLAVAALFAVSGASQAALTVYTSQAAFLAAVTSSGVDTFAGFSITGSTPSPINRTAGSYTYTATAFDDEGAGSVFFGAGTTANPWLSTNGATDSVVFSGFSSGVNGIGGNFFGSNIAGAFQAGNVTLVATDSTGATSTQTITGATTSSFLGFISTGSIATLTLTAVQPSATTFLWGTTDNLTLATAVPEPGTYAMLLAGLGVVGFIARRRRA